MTLSTVRSYLESPEVQEQIQTTAQELYERGEREFQALFLKSIKRTGTLIARGEGEIALEAIKMVWQSLGRYNPKGPDTNINNYNQQAGGIPLEREDAKTILDLLREKRKELKTKELPHLKDIEV